MQHEYIDTVGISLEAPCNENDSNKSGIHIATQWSFKSLSCYFYRRISILNS